MAGRGRGGRGLRLAEALKAHKAQQQLGGDQSSQEESGSRTSTPSPEPVAVPAIGGRGKLKQFIMKRANSNSSKSGSESGDTPSTPSSPGSQVSPGARGAVGGATAKLSSLAITPGGDPKPLPLMKPIEDKQRGVEGRVLDVAVNYIKVMSDPAKGIYDYSVAFEPAVDSRGLRHRMLKSEELQSVIGPVLQFTGMNMYLPRKLSEERYVVTTTMPTDNTPVTITINYVKRPPSEELMPFYNTLFRRVMHALRLVQIQRHYYDPTLKIEIPQHKLEVWPGFVTAIQEYDGGLMLNCDASHRVLRTNTARDVLQDILHSPDGRTRFKEMARQRLIGCIVLTRYNNQPYRIDDVDFDKNPTHGFTLANGNETTYIDYFRNHWEQNIVDQRQPLLIHRPKPRRGETESRMISLIPELSYMTGLTDDIRSDFRAMRDIASHTRVKPHIRLQKLQQFIVNVNANTEAATILSDWGITLDPSPNMLKARQISPETLFFGNGKQMPVGPKAEWGPQVRTATLLSAMNIDRWVFIYTKRDAQQAEEFAKTLTQVARNMGFNFGNPRRSELMNDSATSYVDAIRSTVTGAQLVVLMTPGSSQREDRYNAIKKLLCCDIPIPSQVVRANTLQGTKMRAVCQNIALQITCKVGGQLWGVKIPFQSCMIVGLDVYHDSSLKGRSVVGVVASLNKEVTRWYTRVFFQGKQEEVLNILQSAIVSCLKKFYETNHFLPARVFIFRDGVGDGQVGMVKDFEIPQMEEAIENYVSSTSEQRPTVSVVIVQKRINMKMMMKTPSNTLDNPPPGSIMDHSVTRPIYYDFFLISQHVTQGTVTPTHYITVYDKNNMTPDRMQRLTYKMTHLYYNFPSTIRVPAPCQYAHKVAYLIGQNVRKAPSETLCDKLFFL